MTASYHDQAFRELFEEEAGARLARLSEQLLQLEQTGPDADLVASIFREAHTLKGAAAVVGLDDASRVAHALEGLLEDLRSGRRDPSPGLVDVALNAVDGLASIISRTIAGEECSSEADALEGHLLTWVDSDGIAEPGLEAALTGGRSVSDQAVSDHGPAPADVATRAVASEAVHVPMDRLDELVRLVGETAAAQLRVGCMLTERFGLDPVSVAEFRELSRVVNDLQERTMRVRMVPVSTVTDQLHRAVRDLSRSLGKQVSWEVRGADTELDRGVLQHLADPLLHLVRNAVDHGVESPDDRVAAGKKPQAAVRLHAMQLGSEVIIAVTDDGRGIDVQRVRVRAARQGIDTSGLTDEEALFLIFRSGLSTADSVSEVSGRGVGLDVVRTSVEAVRGRLEVRSQPGGGSEIRIIVPITLAVLPCLLVASGETRYAIPMHSVTVATARDPRTAAHAEGRPLIWINGSTVAVSSLQQTLGGTDDAELNGPVVVVTGTARSHAFRVDALLGQRDVVVKGLSRLLPRLDVLAGASVDPDGSILLVLDAAALIERARKPGAWAGEQPGPFQGAPAARGSILVVDDALTVRELQRSILERDGFDVRVAADGHEALALLAERQPDLVLTDVEMPRMDGFELTQAIRSHPRTRNLPVLMLTSRASETDRQRGLDAGADGYIIKSGFDETRLLEAVNGLLGRHS
ncbi:MAG: response regulator [Acidimicrobiales bacterium]|nr:response regulator [Acidimicrobiales bacterium]